MTNYVYSFIEGDIKIKALLGGKGANLAEMMKIGLPVPSGFTITTEACNQYFHDGNTVNSEIKAQIEKAVIQLENQTEKQFGGDPCLLVSVRSGSVFSMPGMMDTILNLGLNDENIMSLAKSTNSKRFALDCYRRFIQMYSNVVLDLPMYQFESILEEVKEKNNIDNDQELTEDHLIELIKEYKNVVQQGTGKEFEQSPKKQLYAAIEAVFKSWNNERAKIYRQINNIPSSVGTAINIQMMVFGNMGDASGTGVVFTRNPSTGEDRLFGEFLMNAQGEDVVAGIRTPNPIDELASVNQSVYDELCKASRLLEDHYRDMQDIEFTIENGKFYLLQTRNGKRSASAATKIAVDFVNKGIISKEDVLKNFDLAQVDQLLHPEFHPEKLASAKELTVGLPASPGAATGQICFDTQAAEEACEKGEKVILVRIETSPEDIKGMLSSNGVLTARGGMTSHAAVVARGMGKCCVSGCIDLQIDEEKRLLKIGEHELCEGDYLSIDGTTGKVYLGQVETSSANLSDEFATIMAWADEVSDVHVLANADTPQDAKKAIAFGAKGIGLCRTEHMFFAGDRITDMREMILSQNEEGRKIALNKLYPYQKEDFKLIFKTLKQQPVNIRLLDPPLHEFIPKEKGEIMKLAKDLNVTYDRIEKITEQLTEVNPMMGMRGCRLGLIYPEIYEMQARAIIDAALEVTREEGFVPSPEIMIPLVGNEIELSKLRSMVEVIKLALDVDDELGEVKIGTMIEVPRACLVADKIAEHADYFSFGTNDLTQMTLGYSRDDSGTFIAKYKMQKILDEDPFQKIDQAGVGELMKIAITKAKTKKTALKIGVCGEQAGDSESLTFFNSLGIDYVSCSPYRIPKARLAAAQAAISYAVVEEDQTEHN
ncbi:pyruvate, phosphate dikinase [Reichenbachiella carrageenanivorans]|uniref:Pyruvate, phosphate dikinase n=1 Tax=Reichenbachiella carrageenanivorans TaxID=2979869 RepID=A0ABY6D108_9BACT|nr:pyruvate, phosphate dikinase [Reichenbachiella carrageenanivorans]UXX79836.1 pyruvate, phosphate dikinase [Reichenbachiella carrageenanivorans]